MEYASQHQWTYGGKVFEVNNFYDGDHDAWCYELYQTEQNPGRNDYIEIRIPDLTPDGPFTPAAASEAIFLAHGEPRIPHRSSYVCWTSHATTATYRRPGQPRRQTHRSDSGYAPDPGPPRRSAFRKGSPQPRTETAAQEPLAVPRPSRFAVAFGEP
ncbi:hypothetical protein Ais01nite_68100 [Asanoa ishikariensis]|uniref:hypothetical protein n=1 Tax=Asanoa ishikariensis TaxID=137265 RepID=UPI00116000DB|nr:hypothetical protein [Asanoa ishikariensis]GIF68775.1 hypothetical protein Ais01nite_68100 [Asanoa ishikariensis]